jgi:demethylmenaquinone methyltransferase/2-methoxy-6-polyprenyl-1,4-benzoquinol methylase
MKKPRDCVIVHLNLNLPRLRIYPTAEINSLRFVKFHMSGESYSIAESQLNRQVPTDAAEPDSKVSYVRHLFSEGPHEYDFLLKILSLGRDGSWRNCMREGADLEPNSTILDIACGTGLVTYAFARKDGAYAVGVDVTMEMLRQAIRLDSYKKSDVDFVLARAENLPFRNECFDASMISLALRNVSSQVETLSEMSRCTKRGRIVMSLDFARPRGKFFGPFYNFYIFKVLPSIGRLISKHWKIIFLYLANSIQKSRDPEKIEETMNSIGLVDTKIKRLTHGTTALVSGRK